MQYPSHDPPCLSLSSEGREERSEVEGRGGEEEEGGVTKRNIGRNNGSTAERVTAWTKDGAIGAIETTQKKG